MSFRDWMESLRNTRGNQALWPYLLGYALDTQYRSQQSVREAYSGEVFVDRDQHEYLEGDSERRQVASFYHLCLRETEGLMLIDGHPIWLLGYEWPNQGGVAEKGRRADLVGLGTDGGLIVFECKRADNSDPPLIALLEGLDYLACLMRDGNFEKLLRGFDSWASKPEKVVPPAFQGVAPCPTVAPSVIVLAPEDYYTGRHHRSRRGSGLSELLDAGTNIVDSVHCRFACSDFTDPDARLLKSI